MTFIGKQNAEVKFRCHLYQILVVLAVSSRLQLQLGFPTGQDFLVPQDKLKMMQQDGAVPRDKITYYFAH